MLRLRTLLSAFVALAFLVAGGTVVQAAPGGPAKPGGTAGESCAVVLAPLQPGQTVSEVLSLTCGTDVTSSTRLAAAATLLGAEYDGSGFTGGAWFVYGGGASCNAGASYGFASIGGWDNRISSARTYNGCQSRHYDGTSYTGSSWLCWCSSMGTMSNRTSSIYYF
jgi:hypothetical protein